MYRNCAWEYISFNVFRYKINKNSRKHMKKITFQSFMSSKNEKKTQKFHMIQSRSLMTVEQWRLSFYSCSNWTEPFTSPKHIHCFNLSLFVIYSNKSWTRTNSEFYFCLKKRKRILTTIRHNRSYRSFFIRIHSHATKRQKKQLNF